jgi:predicted MFS family arabinose efflux permease
MPHAAVLLALIAMGALSQFYRASFTAIAPDIGRELALTPESMGLIGGAFFMSLVAVQIPVGLAFDRIGTKKTVMSLTGVGVVGLLLHAAADSAETLFAARLLIGFGAAATFMGAVVLCSRWFAGPPFATSLSLVFSFSHVGTLMAGTPLAWTSATFGWRWAFLAAAVVTLAVAAGFQLAVSDRPPGEPETSADGESLRDIVAGLGEVFRTPGLWPILALHSVAYASMSTVLGLWAGPYLADVHDLGTVERGHVLLAMGLAQVVGILCYGPMDRVFNTRKWVAVAGAVGTLGVLAALALLPAPSAFVAVALLIALCAVAAYSVAIVAHARGLFPDRLAGRGVTTSNIAQSGGTALLPVLTGAVVGLFPMASGGSPPEAYRWVFGCLAVALSLGLVAYLGSKDVKPRP